jgi:hypothetical protein
MRTALLTFFCIAGLTSTAWARLGETADQLVVRYGQPLSEADQKGEGDKIPLAEVVFQKGGFRIKVTLTNGISVAESLQKINGQPLTPTEIGTLLTINSQGHGWEAPQMVDTDKLWTRDDSATARLAQDGSLTIKSPELLSAQAMAKKLEHSPSLEGF